MKVDRLDSCAEELSPESGARRAGRGPRRARLEGITPEGRVVVCWGEEGQMKRGIVDLATSISDHALLRAIEERASCVIDFLDDDASAPVLLGLLRDRLDVAVQDARLVRETRHEIVTSESLTLRCGAAAIELHKDGQVLIRGADVRTTATGGVAIQGAHVELN